MKRGSVFGTPKKGLLLTYLWGHPWNKTNLQGNSNKCPETCFFYFSEAVAGHFLELPIRFGNVSILRPKGPARQWALRRSERIRAGAVHSPMKPPYVKELPDNGLNQLSFQVVLMDPANLQCTIPLAHPSPRSQEIGSTIPQKYCQPSPPKNGFK